ncbi:helix-turn-helix domain-containing protein [Streptomyces monomycini]|uniref:helix-turn-helix domain-containing protein n=1 Tax=Streptomyces monomycini TaxID=371720 RepID=UPI0004AB678B|nr:helix-turn-helix transcriptional regulator [Streptomyces monomycini]
MVLETVEPSPVRTHVGGLIRHCRQRAGMTQKQLAHEAHVSESLEGAYERGERIPNAGFLLDADDLTTAGGLLATSVPLLEQESNRAQYLEWRLLEAEALSLSGYVAAVLPGLLQSPDYIRALYCCRVPAFSDEEIERMLRERLGRHSVLNRKRPPVVSFVVEQAALERPLGGNSVLKGALLHVAQVARSMRHLTVQVMPTRVKMHAGLVGSVQLLTSPDGRKSAYFDGDGRSKLLTRPNEAIKHAERYGALRAQALSPEESLVLMERLAGEL